eukprot:8112756-Lingulodinium_polyedra.AAC.1
MLLLQVGRMPLPRPMPLAKCERRAGRAEPRTASPRGPAASRVRRVHWPPRLSRKAPRRCSSTG